VAAAIAPALQPRRRRTAREDVELETVWNGAMGRQGLSLIPDRVGGSSLNRNV
jgi:hypothetical protein